MSSTRPKPPPSVNGRLEVLPSTGLGRGAFREANKGANARSANGA